MLVHAIDDYFPVLGEKCFRRVAVVDGFAFTVANCNEAVGINSEANHFADNSLGAALGKIEVFSVATIGRSVAFDDELHSLKGWILHGAGKIADDFAGVAISKFSAAFAEENVVA